MTQLLEEELREKRQIAGRRILEIDMLLCEAKRDYFAGRESMTMAQRTELEAEQARTKLDKYDLDIAIRYADKLRKQQRTHDEAITC